MQDPHLWMLLGSACLQLKDFAAAEKAGRAAIAINSGEQKGWDVIIQSCLAQGKIHEAIAGLQTLVSIRPQSTQLYYQLAELTKGQGDVRKALQYYRRAIDCDERNMHAQFGLGNLLLQSEIYIEAIEQFSKILQIAPNSGQAMHCLGNGYMALSMYQEAEDIYKAALVFEPNNKLIHHNLAEAYQNQSKLNEAEVEYRQAISLDPKLVEAYVNLGRTLQKQGRLSDAINCHNQALKINTSCSAAHHNIAICVYDDKNLNMAAASFQAAIDLNPDNLLAKCFLGVIGDQLGDLQGVKKQAVNGASPLTDSIIESYQFASNANQQARYFSTTAAMLDYAITKATVDGLYLEFGVCFGTSINIIASRVECAVHGFDSFEGLPEAWETGSSVTATDDQAGTYSTRGQLPQTLDNVTLYPGLFDTTLPGFVDKHSGSVSFINVDCDLYSSTKTVFDNLGSRIVPGTVIVFDEFFCYPEWRQHEYKAFQEFVADAGVDYEYLAFSYFTGQAIVRIL
ncbi:MAG: tetratricopeptide repeat protein [Gammaproteobacteria bacterium]